MRLAALAVAALLAGAAAAQMTAAERQGLLDVLSLGNLSPRDLAFERDAFPDPKRMQMIALGMRDPLVAADTLMAEHARAATEPVSALLARAVGHVFGAATVAAPAPAPAEGWLPRGVPAELEPVLRELAGWVAYATQEVREATAQLTEEERRAILQSLPRLAVEEAKVNFAWVRDPVASKAFVWAALAKVDLARISAAGAHLAGAVERAMIPLRRTTVDVPSPVKFRLGGVPVVLAGRSDDLHEDTDAWLTIDLGGDDRYRGRHGAGIGHASVLIDMGGDDRYDMGDLNIGAGLLGIGIARDVGGNDLFRGGSLNLGAGLAGLGAFAKEGGNDVYDSVALAQGFGQFGVGLMVDTRGEDRYNLKLFGQGAARTQGLGWLIDRAGSDVYRTGGLSLNTPLFKDVHYSFAQGFGMGYRDDATGGESGGAGLLTDLAGDDFYLAESYAQAASYWYALGTLYDAAGHDTYTGYHYVQASAMHLCAAYLFDLAGDDAYVTKFGASHAIGHDYAVAMLLDRAGSDVYAARDSTPGVGNANGVGLFLDAAGEDRYQGPPGKGNPARGSGSVGVFADLGGADLYRTGLADGQGSVTETWGVALDVEDPRPRATPAPAQPGVGLPEPGSLARPSDAALERIYERATQWAVGVAQAEVRENLDKLILIGLPAFEWMLDRKLEEADGLQRRAFVAVVGALGEEGRRMLARKLLSENDDVAHNALAIASEAKVREAAPALVGLIRRPPLRRMAVRAAGAIGGEEVVAELLPLCASEDEMLATQAMVALAQIGSETAYPTADALATSPNLPLRKAALSLMARFPLRAIESARRMLLDADERTARIGIELMGLIGTPEALEEAAQRLLDPAAGLRIQAMLALDGRCPPEHRAALLALRDDPDPLVRAVAQRIAPGR
jgi:hypothetical protein